MEQHTVINTGWVLQGKRHRWYSETGPASQNVWRFMLQVLLREEENIPDLHITGIFKTASNGGDVQWNQTLGTCNQGALLWVAPPLPRSASPRLSLDVRAVAYSLTQRTTAALTRGMDWARWALGKILLGQTSLRHLTTHPEDNQHPFHLVPLVSGPLTQNYSKEGECNRLCLCPPHLDILSTTSSPT